MENSSINISSSPHAFGQLSTSKIMFVVIFSLLPICINGVVLYGFQALAVILTSVCSCVVFEALFQLATKRTVRIKDFSAVVTGILLALVLPPAVPLWQVVLGAAFAIIVAKEFFGGIGANVFNPALAGRAFMVISFPTTAAGNWVNPIGATDATSSATILTQVSNSSFSNQNYLDFFFGLRGGCIGESSIMWILVAFVLLLLVKVIDWKATVTMVGTVALGTLLAGGDVLAAVMGGGLLFGAVFMITDFATTPVNSLGKIIFAFGCGLITFLIRQFGGFPEGVMFSILIMNTLTPFLNKITPRKYGYQKAGSK